MSVSPEFHTKVLRKQLTRDEYRIYRAGLEWDLTDPIVMESADDLRSSPRWQDRVTPYHHQVTNLITFCRRLPVTLLADDVGLGKTISAGLIASELMSRGRVGKFLIVCPKLLAEQWQAELAEKFDIRAKIAIGSALITADPQDADAVITTYASARLHLAKIEQDRFQMLILDEAHKLRNLFGVANSPQVAKVFHKALEDRRFPFVLMLTATPIQNRLWDLYSLVDLLTVARGHENPFGSPGMFARRFIADDREQARQLKPEARDEFRSIVYGYMSRVRRGDAKLYFPDRVVQMHRIDATPAELQLIETIAGPIQKLNRLAQIGILLALTSSPDALNKQLSNMARNGTVPASLAAAVEGIVRSMPTSAKLNGLGSLINGLKKQNPDGWRVVVFTIRRETQTTIQAFLERMGLKVGIINGDSGQRNQETIARFRKNPPDIRVIVSTEAGSEGVNLQVANVLVNYDLPWNPMIVEQRIGRVQRLGGEHAHVSIFNMMLRNTFEEHIVGRLMTKLQMASHAIGDVEALLQASDIGDGDDDSATTFEDRILELVLAALAKKDFEKAAALAEKSIDDAQLELQREESNINELLGSMDGAEYVGPRAPTLPPLTRSMQPDDFVLAAFTMLGAKVTALPPDLYAVEENGGRQYIHFVANGAGNTRSTLYSPGSPPFQRLASRVVATGVHDVVDLDADPSRDSANLAKTWADGLGATVKSVETTDATMHFAGEALLRARATVAHDSYERLVSADCSVLQHNKSAGAAALRPIPKVIEDPRTLGLDLNILSAAAAGDDGISEFNRFYLERRAQEIHGAGSDARKRKRLDDEFTPRLELTLAGLKGEVHRQVKVRLRYAFDAEEGYVSDLTVVPHLGKLVDPPALSVCSKSGRSVPISCLDSCAISGVKALRHLLVKSEVSGRLALPEFTEVCSLSGKRILQDEADTSDVTGRRVARTLLKTSAISGKKGEPEYFGLCAFTRTRALSSEMATSELSDKLYRADQGSRSSFSGKTGHQQEFVECYETRQPIARKEAEKCEVTGHLVRPGVLTQCEVTGKRVLPSELQRCSATGKRALKTLFVVSSVSDRPLLESVAIRSLVGDYCRSDEAQVCVWSGSVTHPDDIRVCALTGLSIHVRFATQASPVRLRPLAEMLDGLKRTADETQLWPAIAPRLAQFVHAGKAEIEAALLSPAKEHLAICASVPVLLGLRAQHVGAVHSFADNAIVGQVARGRRSKQGWHPR